MASKAKKNQKTNLKPEPEEDKDETDIVENEDQNTEEPTVDKELSKGDQVIQYVADCTERGQTWNFKILMKKFRLNISQCKNYLKGTGFEPGGDNPPKSLDEVKAISKVVQKEIVERANAETSVILDYGNFIKAQIEPIANNLQTTPEKLIAQSVSFYIKFYNKQKPIVEQLESANDEIAQLKELLTPVAQEKLQRAELKDLILSCVQTGNDVPPEITTKFLEMI